MEKEISIAFFIQAIKCLPSDKPKNNARKWYKTQKEHWIGWLSEYNGPGAYGRKSGQNRDAKFAYNHIMCSEMLLFLIRAIPLKPELIEAAEKEYQNGSTLLQKAHSVGAIRKIVPWSEIYQSLYKIQ
jgi:hypothetical protein